METLMQNEDPELWEDNKNTHYTNIDAASSESFKPQGAIAFFILLIMLCLIVWYGIYFVMLQRN